MTASIKFYLDEHIPKAVATALSRRGVDVLTTSQAEMLGASDEEQLRFSSEAGRAIVTHDADFLRLHDIGLEHAGIVFCTRSLSIGDYVRGLMLIYTVLAPSEMRNHIEFL
ncbi:MAG: hypothetical protein GXP42_04320 [Chloroflexi bacterium]|nr:hypothetical protein [Chloroflexota bacterium]